MWYSSTKSLLESIVRNLKAEVPEGNDAWQAQTDVVQTCLEQMVALSGPSMSPLAASGSRYVHRPVADKLNRAIPYVRSMLTATRDMDRTLALACGETALQRL